MTNEKKTLIFDTSAINRLASDKQSDILTTVVNFGYQVRISTTSITECSADPDPEHRRQLFGVFKRLLPSANCIIPYQRIIEKHCQAFSSNRSGYDPRQVKIRFEQAEHALFEEVFLDDAESERIRTEDRTWGKEFEAIYKAEKPAFDELFADNDDKRPEFPDFCRVALRDGGPGWGVAITMFEKAARAVISESEIKAFVNKCTPFRAVLVALMWAHYKKTVAGRRSKSVGKAGRQDLMSAAYLPYANVFVTDDAGQHNAMKDVALEAGLSAQTVLYGAFAANFRWIRP